VDNNAFDNFTLSGSAGATVAANSTLRFVGRMERGTAGVPGQTAFGRADQDAFFQRHDGTFGMSFDRSAGALHQHASYGLAISHQRSADLVVDPSYTPSFEGRTAPFEFDDFTYDTRTDLRRHRASYQVDGTISTRAAGTHVESAVIDWDGERADLGDAMAGTSVPASRDNVGVTLQHQALWSRLFVTAGVRFEHNDSFGNSTVPRVSAAWFLRKGGSAFGATRITGSAGKGIKEPTVLQSFSPSPYFLGNPDLLPERTRALEIGLDQRFASDRARVAFTWFDNSYRDIISLKTDYATFYSQYFNIGLTTARGAELSGDVALVSGLRAKAGYTFTDSKIVESTSDSEVFTPGNWAFRRPRHAGFIGLAWSGARASIDLSGTLVGRRVDSDFSALVPAMVENEGYGLWDLRGAYRLTRALSATLAIDNLAGSDHMEPLGYPVLGRAFRAGLRARF
jgi:outer membrane cobalamin receptor